MSDRIVIIVSPYFPPSTLAGVHRARHLAKHLPAAGWTPIVLCVDEPYHEQDLDPALAALVPEHVQIVKTTAVPARLTRGLGFGDISLRAWWPLRRALIRLLQTRPVGAVLITGSPFYPMLFAPAISGASGFRSCSIFRILGFQPGALLSRPSPKPALPINWRPCWSRAHCGDPIL